MFFIKLFRYICGSVYFYGIDGFFERFVNLCSSNNIRIRDIKFSENLLEGCVNCSQYKKLRHIAKKSGVRLKVKKKYGLPFFIKNNKNRVGLLFGVIFFISFMSFTSSFIWNIEVQGAENVRQDEVISACENLGLKEGAAKKKIDTNELSRLLMIELSGKVSWLSVNIKGTKAVVEVRDYEAWREDETYKDPCNIIADFDGVIMYMEVYNGAKVAKEGSGVIEGDLLISGIVENRDTSSQFCEARGRAAVLHNKKISISQEKSSSKKYYIKSEKIRILNIFGLKIPLEKFKRNNYLFDEFQREKFMNYGKVKLPISLIEKTRAYYEYKNESVENYMAYAADKITTAHYEENKNTLILSEKFLISNDNDNVFVQIQDECVDFMGKKQIIYIE